MSSAIKSAPVVATLLGRIPLPPLSPVSKWNPELSNEIEAVSASVNIRAGECPLSLYQNDSAERDL